MLQLDFSYSAPVFVDGRPRVNVQLLGEEMQSATYLCIVSTGADYLQLPALAARQAKLNMSYVPLHPVVAASGRTVQLPLLSNVRVSVNGLIIITDVLFDPSNTAPPIFGWRSIQTAFDAGFGPEEWFWEPRRL